MTYGIHHGTTGICSFFPGYGGLTKEQINDAMDEALNSAKGGRRGSMKNLPMTLPDGNRKVDMPDPAKMAEQMKDVYAAMKPEDDLMIFVSTSMPAATLKLLGEQAKRAGTCNCTINNDTGRRTFAHGYKGIGKILPTPRNSPASFSLRGMSFTCFPMIESCNRLSGSGVA